MYTPLPIYPYVEQNMFVKSIIQEDDSFVYLGSTHPWDGAIDYEINLRIEKASKFFRNLESCVWSDRGITFKTKLSVYEAGVLYLLFPVLLKT